MLNGYLIIDADSHVIEPPTMWAEYLEPEFKQFAPSAEMKIKGEDIVEKVSEQVRTLGNKQMMEAHRNAYFKGYNAESHVQEMVLMGIDSQMLLVNWLGLRNIYHRKRCKRYFGIILLAFIALMIKAKTLV